MPTVTLFLCGLFSGSMTMTEVDPDELVTTAACGITSAPGTVLAIISTRRLVPALSFSPGLTA